MTEYAKDNTAQIPDKLDHKIDIRFIDTSVMHQK